MSCSCISVRGARHHNLKNIDVDIPLHQLTVITGLSGSGKSTLAFDTLYAEGQRRYVETFSPYTRQFLERMDKPQVDRIDGIPPAIAIEQANPVKTSRSTVGTMTEIADYLKWLYARAAELLCPKCGRLVRPHTVEEISSTLLTEMPNQDAYIGFHVAFPEKTNASDAFAFLQQQGFLRVWIEGKVHRTDASLSDFRLPRSEIWVIQDRLRLSADNRSRLAEAVEAALRLGKGVVRILPATAIGSETERAYANRCHCPYDRLDFKEPTPSLFSFNNPVGACPTCRGFGRTIEIDYELALPDRTLSIAQGVVKPWQSGVSAECQKDLLKHCKKEGIPTDVPFFQLPKDQQRFVIEGELRNASSLNELWEAGGWYGVKGYFQWMETKTYKMHVRVFLSRYRTYKTCPACQGGRFQPETLQFRLFSHHPSGTKSPSAPGLTLADFNRLSLEKALAFLETWPLAESDEASQQLRREITVRLQYLIEVGLGYLTLDRTTRTLSGGEVERVNLTSCLGNSLVNTLFVLDEPSIGLHPRDTGRLLRVIEQLRDRGNTVVLVEHEEAVMRRADHLIDLGPGRGEQGGTLVHTGSFSSLLKNKKSLTGRYLSGNRVIPVPERRRPADFKNPRASLQLVGASENNLKNIDVAIPLGLFTVVTGVSGSGKSTLVHEVLYQNLRKAQNKAVEEPGRLRALKGVDRISDVIRVDQSPLSKTPRSNAALYLGAYEFVRRLFAETEAAQTQGFTASDFSFNTGAGRCPRCGGSGSEKIEMQFLSDVFVTCPQCEGRRFQPHALKVLYRGKSIHDVLQMTVQEALAFFNESDKNCAEIRSRLAMLDEVGLGYLTLGQPLNQLSGGEAQRIKLLSYLTGIGASEDKEEEPLSPNPSAGKGNRLFILDEPTTGLHFEDIRLLLQVFQKIVDQGDSLVVIEHNLEVIKCADWVIDLGPEAGDAGGEVIATGTPEEIAENPKSVTGRFLAVKLNPAKSLKICEEPPRSRSEAFRNSHSAIQIRGARHHNLKNLSLDIRLNETTVVTGLSGSGKSTLAFDLLFAEGQRRYLDSLNAYARQFVEQLEKPEVDSITGIPPAVAIEQRVTRGGRKSTVATVTEIYQFIRLLYAKLGEAYDPETDERAIRQTSDEIFSRIDRARKKGELTLLSPLVKARKGFHTEIAKWASKKGYPFLRVDGRWIEPAKFKPLDRYVEHTVDVVLGNLGSRQSPAERRRLVETALNLGRGTVYTLDNRKRETIYSTQLYCPGSGRSFDELDPRLFSFNSVHGWCPACRGYGTVVTADRNPPDEDLTEVEKEIQEEQKREWADEDELQTCSECGGARLNPLARAVRLSLVSASKSKSRGAGSLTIPDLSRLTIAEAKKIFAAFRPTGRSAAIARDILPEITQRLAFLEEVGLGYLTLDRSANTLSGGESQRIRLAAQLGSNLQGVLYVLDEPTIGLHPRDNDRLLDSLDALKEKGNTLVIVEHDEDTMKRADRIIDLGPGAGVRGGHIVADGPWKKLARDQNSITGKILGEPLKHPLRGSRRPVAPCNPKDFFHVSGACAHNLKSIDAAIPLGRFTVFCGVSGSGKSTLMHEVIRPAVEASLRKKRTASNGRGVPWKSTAGTESFSAVYEVDQSPIGKTSRSTPATYIGLMDELRKLYAQLPLSRQRGYQAGRFSFNSKGGRCEACQGQGVLKVEMNFLPPVEIPCDSCRGNRFDRETLEVLYNGKNIADVLAMGIDEAVGFFDAVPRLQRPLKLLQDTGLGYLTLGQRSPTLSGGEAQRIKLVAELARSLESNTQKRLRTRGFENLHNLYLLEEPTIGLHLADVRRLLDVIHQLVDAGHTVIVIEHHLDVIAEADWVIELGPESGEDGGRIVAQGTPEHVARAKKSATAPYLKKIL
jgi:excinuclease ABC subunit A